MDGTCTVAGVQAAVDLRRESMSARCSNSCDVIASRRIRRSSSSQPRSQSASRDRDVTRSRDAEARWSSCCCSASCRSSDVITARLMSSTRLSINDSRSSSSSSSSSSPRTPCFCLRCITIIVIISDAMGGTGFLLCVRGAACGQSQGHRGAATGHVLDRVGILPGQWKKRVKTTVITGKTAKKVVHENA